MLFVLFETHRQRINDLKQPNVWTTYQVCWKRISFFFSFFLGKICWQKKSSNKFSFDSWWKDLQGKKIAEKWKLIILEAAKKKTKSSRCGKRTRKVNRARVSSPMTNVRWLDKSTKCHFRSGCRRWILICHSNSVIWCFINNSLPF